VSAEQATANLQAIVAFLDPPRLPRVGAAVHYLPLPVRPASVHGPDGIGGLELPRVPLHGEHPSEKVIWDAIKAHPREVTILALGPLKNVSRVLNRDPGIAELIAALVKRIGRPMALRQASAERGGSRGATSNSRDWPGWMRRSLRGAEELPIHAQGRIFLSAQTDLETALLAGRSHRGMECRQTLWMSIAGRSSGDS
jgi:hypothetical protein